MQQFLKLTPIHETSPPWLRDVFPPLYGTLVTRNRNRNVLWINLMTIMITRGDYYAFHAHFLRLHPFYAVALRAGVSGERLRNAMASP